MHANEEAQVIVHDLNPGQKPRLTKEGKTLVCKTDNFVPLVVPGLSTVSGSNSSSTSALQGFSTIPAQERSDELSPGDWCRSPSRSQNKNRGMTIEIRTTVCEIFLNGWRSSQDNLEDTEVSAPAHISQDSESERPTKVVSK